VPSRPFSETRQLDDLLVTLEVTPASIGRNRFRVGVADANGQPADVQRVEITLEMLSMDMGVNRIDVQPDGAGEYIVPEGWLSMVGEWRVRVTLRRADADDVSSDFVVPVGG
jgi:copper transport protein